MILSFSSRPTIGPSRLCSWGLYAIIVPLMSQEKLSSNCFLRGETMANGEREAAVELNIWTLGIGWLQERFQQKESWFEDYHFAIIILQW